MGEYIYDGKIESKTIITDKNGVILSEKINTTIKCNFNLFEKYYGKYVQMDDRFESVHIWNEELAIRNKGRWIPQLIK